MNRIKTNRPRYIPCPTCGARVEVIWMKGPEPRGTLACTACNASAAVTSEGDTMTHEEAAACYEVNPATGLRRGWGGKRVGGTWYKGERGRAVDAKGGTGDGH